MFMGINPKGIPLPLLRFPKTLSITASLGNILIKEYTPNSTWNSVSELADAK